MIAEATVLCFPIYRIYYPHNKKARLMYCCLVHPSKEKVRLLAINNALTISNLNKKVLLIGADLRNPNYMIILTYRKTL
jgi:hypothetical protein